MSLKQNNLGHFEEVVLLATLNLGEEAYGMKIRQLVEEATERTISIGSLYATLDRLERKGFITSWRGEPTEERGGRAKRYFQVNAKGKEAVKTAMTARDKLMTLSDLAAAGVV